MRDLTQARRSDGGFFRPHEPQPCGAPDCTRVTRESAYCKLHRERLARNGSFDLPPRKSVYERFWEKVDERGPDECWVWTGCRRKDGYGQFLMKDGHPMLASRVAFMMVNGYAPPVVRHACDNPPCCNPRHLIPGTHKDNSADMVERQRSVRGEHVAHAKLTAEDVRRIRRRHADGTTVYRIAKDAGMSHGHIRDIVLRRAWAHLD